MPPRSTLLGRSLPQSQAQPAQSQLEPIFRDPGGAQQQLLPDAKHTRINRWRTEIDPSDVVCGCSEHLELVRSRSSGGSGSSRSGGSTSKEPVGPCCWCGRPGESMEERRKQLGLSSSLAARSQKKISLIRRFFNNKRALRESQAVAGGSARDSSASPQPVEEGLTPPMRSERGGTTQMYGPDEADDEASSASSAGKWSDSAQGKGKPKLGVDDTAARLRRAQKLLDAQGKGNG